MTQDGKLQSADYRRTLTIGPVRLSFSEIWGEDRRSIYMSRWIAEFGHHGPTIRLHVIRRPDGDRCLHDHPWSFWTLVLWGGYTEEVEAPWHAHEAPVSGPVLGTVRFIRRVWPLTISRRPLDFRHRIIRLHGRAAVTLVFAGRQRRIWGFFARAGWVPWTRFVEAGKAARALWCSTPGDQP